MYSVFCILNSVIQVFRIYLCALGIGAGRNVRSAIQRANAPTCGARVLNELYADGSVRAAFRCQCQHSQSHECECAPTSDCVRQLSEYSLLVFVSVSVSGHQPDPRASTPRRRQPVARASAATHTTRGLAPLVRRAFRLREHYLSAAHWTLHCIQYSPVRVL